MTDNTIKNSPPLSLKALLQGLAAVALIYVLLILYILISGPKAYQNHQLKLATYVVSITDRSNIEESQSKSILSAENSIKSEKSQPLPEIDSAGRTPFEKYKSSFVLPKDKPVISLAVMDYGLSEKASQEVLSLPKGITFLLNPYAGNPDNWRQKAADAGHETWLYLPLQNQDYPYNDPGALGLMSSKGLTYNKENLHRLLGKTQNYPGVALLSDQAFAGSQSNFESLTSEVFSRGLGYLEINAGSSAPINNIQHIDKTPYIKSNTMLIDPASWEELEERARRSGFATGTIPLYPGTVDFLTGQIARLKEKGYVLAPVSAMAAKPKQSND